MHDTIQPDEIILAASGIVGLAALARALHAAITDVRRARREGTNGLRRIVTSHMVRVIAGITVAQLVLTAYGVVRLTQPRARMIPLPTLVAIYLLPIASLALATAALIYIRMRRRLDRHREVP